MTSFNKDYLLGQFQLIEDYLARARTFASRTKERFVEDGIAVDAAIREITVLFETSHNIAKHLIAENGWRSPQSKAEAFDVLKEMGVVPESLANSFRAAGRFRNLVTYQTTMINNEMVYDILKNHLDDFEKFANHVLLLLEENENG